LWLLSYPGPIREDGNRSTAAFGKKLAQWTSPKTQPTNPVQITL